MREIKFRAWDNHTKTFIFFGGYPTFDDTSNTVTFGCTAILSERDPDGNRFVVTEYTGLKDKDGTSIYEGDIVRKYFHSKVERTGVVEFGLGGAFNLKCEDNDEQEGGWWGMGNPAYPANLEIIGNVWETLKLISNKV